MEAPGCDYRRSSTVERLKPAPSYSHPVTFRYEIQNHTSRMQKITNAFKVYRLTVLTLICVLAGLIIGLICRPFASDWTERQFMYIEMPGELYLRLLKLMIIPLLVSNVILSFGTIQGKLSSHLGKVAGFLYLSSNVLAITVAIVIALLVYPGKSSRLQQEQQNAFQVDYNSDHDESIKRYREYHPMFYHTDKREIDCNVQSTSRPQGKQPKAADPNHVILIRDSQLIKLTERLNRSAELLELHHLEEVELNLDELSSFKLVNVKKTNSEQQQDNTKQARRIGLSTKLPIDVVLDLLRNLVPDNMVLATMQQTRTRLFAPKELMIGKNGSAEPRLPSLWPIGQEMVNQPNIIGLLAISVLAGVVLSHMEEAARPILELCSCIAELSLRIAMISINLTPVCIMFLLIGQVARARNLNLMADELLYYTLTVLVALILHACIILPVAFYLITKRSPIETMLGLFEALVAAFATSSSSATMALMLNCLADLEVHPVIVRAFGPLGSVFNMNGTAIYEAIGAIFIAQTLGITLPCTSLLLIGLSSAVASLSTSGIPSSGVMTMVIVLDAVNLPVLQLSLIYIVDFIIDRFRTVVNCWSGAVVCVVIHHICPESLFEEDMKPDKYRELVKYRSSWGTLRTRKSLTSEENPKPDYINVTITPPLETSYV